MNIAVFIKSTTFHRGNGGLETQNKTVCEELVKRGHQVTVFAPKKDAQFDSTAEKGVNYVFIASGYKNYILEPFNKNSWNKKSLETFTKLHSEKPFDLVISQSASAESIIENKNQLGVKVVAIAHGSAASEYKTAIQNIGSMRDLYWFVRNTQYFVRQFFGRQRRFVLHSNKVIAVSNFVKKALVNECFADERTIEVIHNGVDPVRFSSQEKRENPSVNLLFLGRVEKSKGIFTLLEMVPDIKGNFVVHIVGDGPDLEEAKRRYIGSLGDKVVFHGRVAYEEFSRKITPDIFVFPTQRIEGFPMVLVESMFLGLPVVAFDMGGVPDAIEDGKTGYLVKAGNKKEFKEKLESLIASSEMRNSFGKAAKEKAMKEFTLGKMIDAYENVFREVLK